jgi:hypothetical protein
MAKCMVSGKPITTFQYVALTEGPPPSGLRERTMRLLGLKSGVQRTYMCRFDHLTEAAGALPADFRDPILVKWNPGPQSHRLGLEGHAKLADAPRLRALPSLVRVVVRRGQLGAKLRQILEARSRILND